MRLSIKILFVVIFAAIFSACGIQYPDPVAIKDLKVYTDEITGFSVKYPGNWVTIPIPGKRFTVLSSSNAKSRFIDYNTEGYPGAKIDISIINVAPTTSIDQVVDNAKIFDRKQAHYKVSTVAIGGAYGKKLTYHMLLEDGEFRGENLCCFPITKHIHTPYN